MTSARSEGEARFTRQQVGRRSCGRSFDGRFQLPRPSLGFPLSTASLSSIFPRPSFALPVSVCHDSCLALRCWLPVPPTSGLPVWRGQRVEREAPEPLFSRPHRCPSRLTTSPLSTSILPPAPTFHHSSPHHPFTYPPRSHASHRPQGRDRSRRRWSVVQPRPSAICRARLAHSLLAHAPSSPHPICALQRRRRT